MTPLLGAFLIPETCDCGPLLRLTADAEARPAWVSARLWRLPSGRVVLERDPQRHLRGVLTAPLPEEQLPVIDLLQGCAPHRIARIRIAVQVERGSLELAWTWSLRRPSTHGARPIGPASLKAPPRIR